LMDADLRQYLDNNFARIDERFAAVHERFVETEGRIDQKLAHLEERVNARIEKIETNLLTAFHGWARPMEIRVQGVATMVLGFEERLALAEQRISELERKRGN
jgi:hypothetical protein